MYPPSRAPRAPRASYPTARALNAPLSNPYDKFGAAEFDSWIGGLTGALRAALDHDAPSPSPSPPPQPALESMSAQLLNAAAGESEEAEAAAPATEDVDMDEEEEYAGEDSFAHTAVRASARAKGKARDPRDGPGFGASASAAIEVLSDEEEDEYDAEGVYVRPAPCGDDDEEEEEEEDDEEYEEEDSEEESSVVTESEESEDEAYNKPGSSAAHIARARRLSEGALAFDDEEEDAEAADVDEVQDDAEQPPELPDRWAPAHAYAEDFYAGGDAPRADGSPDRLTPELRAISPGLHPDDEEQKQEEAEDEAEAEIIDVDELDDDDDEQEQQQEEEDAEQGWPLDNADDDFVDEDGQNSDPGARETPAARALAHAAAHHTWDYPPAVPTARKTTRPGHLVSAESDEALELLYPGDDDDDGAEVEMEERDASPEVVDVDALEDEVLEYDEGAQEQEDEQEDEEEQYHRALEAHRYLRVESAYTAPADAEDEGDADEDELDGDDTEAEDVQSVKARQKSLFGSAADVLADADAIVVDSDGDGDEERDEAGAEGLRALAQRPKSMSSGADSADAILVSDDDDEPADAVPVRDYAPSPTHKKQQPQKDAFVAAADVYGDNSAGLFDAGPGSDSDSDGIVEVPAPATVPARAKRPGPGTASAGLALHSSSDADEDADEDGDALANPFGLPAAAPSPLPVLTPVPAAQLTAAPAVEADRVDPAPDLAALGAHRDSSPPGFALRPAVFSPAELAGLAVTVGAAGDYSFASDNGASDSDAESNASRAAGKLVPVEHEREGTMERWRKMLGPDVVLAGDAAPALDAPLPLSGSMSIGEMYTDPGAPAPVPPTPVPVAGPEPPARAPTPEADKDAAAAAEDADDGEEDAGEEDGMYTDPGAPAPIDAPTPTAADMPTPFGFAGADEDDAPTPAPRSPEGDDAAYVVEEPASPASTARSVAPAPGATADSAYVVESDGEEAEAATEEGLSPVEEEDEEVVEEEEVDELAAEIEEEVRAEDRAREDTDAGREVFPDAPRVAHEPPAPPAQAAPVPPPVMPFIPPAAARAIGEDMFGRAGAATPGALFTPRGEAPSGLFTPLGGSAEGTPVGTPRDEAAEAERKEEKEEADKKEEEEELLAVRKEAEASAREVYVAPEEIDGDEAIAPESAPAPVAEEEPMAEEAAPDDAPPIPSLDDPLGIPPPPAATAQLAPFAGVDDLSSTAPTADELLATFDAPTHPDAPADVGALLANPDASPAFFAAPEDAPEIAHAAEAATSEPAPHTVTVSLEGEAPPAKAVAVEDDPALETDATEVGVVERKMDEEAGLAAAEEERADEADVDPFALMGNGSATAPGAVESDDDSATAKHESHTPSDKDAEADEEPVQETEPLAENATASQDEPEPAQEPIARDFAEDAAPTPAPVDEAVLNGAQELTADADADSDADAIADSTPIASPAPAEADEEQPASQKTEVPEEASPSPPAERAPSVDEEDAQPKPRKRKRTSDQPGPPRITRSASSFVRKNGKNGAPASVEGKGKARADDGEYTSDASDALVHGMLEPSSRAGSVSSRGSPHDDHRPPLVQLDAHTEFIMHQHGRPKAAPSHVPQTIAQAQAAHAAQITGAQTRTKVTVAVEPVRFDAESSRASSAEPHSEPDMPAPATPPMMSASAPAPATGNGAQRPTAPRRIPSKNTPVTRANCRFHTISFAREDGPRAQFVVPGCAMGDAELMQEADIRDEGFATTADHHRMMPDVESLDLDSYLVGTLRQLVGVDLLREREVFYLPREDEQPPRKKRRKHARKSTLDRVRAQAGEGHAAHSRASTPGASTDGGTGSARLRRGGSSVASSVAGDFDTDEEGGEDNEKAKPASVAHSASSSAASSASPSAAPAKSPRKRTLSTRTSMRGPRKLNPDAAEYMPGKREREQEEQDGEDDAAPGPSARRKRRAGAAGSKRNRTMDDVTAEAPKAKRTRTSLRKSVSVNPASGRS